MEDRPSQSTDLLPESSNSKRKANTPLKNTNADKKLRGKKSRNVLVKAFEGILSHITESTDSSGSDSENLTSDLEDVEGIDSEVLTVGDLSSSHNIHSTPERQLDAAQASVSESDKNPLINFGGTFHFTPAPSLNMADQIPRPSDHEAVKWTWHSWFY